MMSCKIVGAGVHAKGRGGTESGVGRRAGRKHLTTSLDRSRLTLLFAPLADPPATRAGPWDRVYNRHGSFVLVCSLPCSALVFDTFDGGSTRRSKWFRFQPGRTAS